MRLRTLCGYCTGLLCVLVIIAGMSMSLSGVFRNLLNNKIKEEVILANGTQSFSVWENPPPPVYMQFYFFNLTNPAEVLSGDRPAVVQIGPYTYREYRPKAEVRFLDNGTKVTAINPKTYVFEASMSNGAEDDLVRTVSIPAVAAMEKFRYNSLVRRVINDLMTSLSIGVFTTVKVGELLWGYEDPLLKALKIFVPDDHFGLFYKKNGSDDGEYELFTGKQNYQDFARIDRWNGRSSLDWWSTDECNMINGTDGASFHPIITRSEKLYLFSSDLCRSLYATYVSDVTVRGIPGFRFSPPSEVFANISVNPDNAGFCVSGNCLASGLLNVSVCKEGAPIVMSSPHFYQADKKFVQDIYGMNPQPEEHQTFIDIHPLSGLVLQAAKRLQVNVFLEQIPEYSQTEKIRTLVFPVMYMNESVLIDAESAGQLRTLVTQTNVVLNVPFIVIAVGIFLGIIFIVSVCKRPEGTAAEQQPLLSS